MCAEVVYRLGEMGDQPVIARRTTWYDLAMEVRAFGITTRNVSAELGGHKLSVLVIDEPTLHFESAQLVILPAWPELSKSPEEHPRATNLLANKIFKASRAGQMICVVYSENDPAHARFVCARLLERLGLMTEAFAPSLERIYAEEFADYFSVYGVPGFIFTAKEGLIDRLHPLAGPGDETYRVSAFAVAEGDGLIYVVPGNIVSGSETQFVAALASAIEAHASRIRRPTTAPIVQAFVFEQEAKVRGDREAKQTELEGLDARLTEYAARKDILFLRDDPLADAVPAWISKHLGLPTSRQEEYIEDFWLLDKNGEKAAICEAKGLDKNVQRKHITALVLHRDERELADTYPSLLVVNTFADAKTEKQKGNQRVGSRECKKAVRDHVLVVRTLDLVRLLDQLDRNLVSVAGVWKLLTTSKGWLKVEVDSREVVQT